MKLSILVEEIAQKREMKFVFGPIAAKKHCPTRNYTVDGLSCGLTPSCSPPLPPIQCAVRLLSSNLHMMAGCCWRQFCSTWWTVRRVAPQTYTQQWRA